MNAYKECLWDRMGMCDCDCIENVICKAKEVLCTQEQYRYMAVNLLYRHPVFSS